MAKCILSDELYEDYENEEECFGKMYNPEEGACQDCSVKEQCQEAQKASTVIKATQADPADVYTDNPEDWTREATTQFIEQSAKDASIPVEKVEMKTRDKFYVNDSQIFTVTGKTLKCLDSKPSE